MTETRVEYAVRYDDFLRTGEPVAFPVVSHGVAARLARELRLEPETHASVVRRTVTYGEWEPVSD